ncbi:uncharacterized protein Tco025E_05802 [Trypanosoma conorhini]|uniref:Uncharacterized protein n=1 Tax=Trypanosoma conorhini TaxID=83891 RepID=A0A422PA76_9TRYP|nr:uncharacterized protein Tco025E_05802 [Trypanosoma conorhini]RNF14625.1 hypothetical protein Tco025E_05802 [Trypanosoma conorhini]
MDGAAALGGVYGAPLAVISMSGSFVKALHISPQQASLLCPVFATRVRRQSVGILTTSWLPRLLLVTGSGQLLLIDASDGRVTHEASLVFCGPPPAAEDQRLVHIVLQQQQARDAPKTTLWMRVTVNNSLFAAILRFNGPAQGLPLELLRVILHFVPERHVSVQQCVRSGPLAKYVGKSLCSLSEKTCRGKGGAARGAFALPRPTRTHYMNSVVAEEQERKKALRAETAAQQRERNEEPAQEHDAQAVGVPHLTAEEVVLPDKGAIAAEAALPSEADEEEEEDNDGPRAVDHAAEPQGTPTETLSSSTELLTEAEAHDAAAAPSQSEKSVSADLTGQQPLRQEGDAAELGFELPAAAGPTEAGELPGRAATDASARRASTTDEAWMSPWRGTEPNDAALAGREAGDNTANEEPWRTAAFPPHEEEAAEEKETCMAPPSQPSGLCAAATPAIITESNEDTEGGLAHKAGSRTPLEVAELPPPLLPAYLFRLDDKPGNAAAVPVAREPCNVEESLPVCSGVAAAVPPHDSDAGPLQVNGAHILSVYPLQRSMRDATSKSAERRDAEERWRQAYQKNLGKKAESRVCETSPVRKYRRDSLSLYEMGTGLKFLGDR